MSHQSLMKNDQTDSVLDPRCAQCAHPAQTGRVANLLNSTLTKQSHRNASPVQEGLPIRYHTVSAIYHMHVLYNCNLYYIYTVYYIIYNII